jgi:transcription initiation factor TFIID subunit TAF12
MSRQLSIERVLAELKDRVEQHRSKAAFHAEQETFHQQEKVRHTAELQTVSERFETFRAAADAVGELVARPREEMAADDSIPAGKGAVLSKLVERLVARKGPIEAFGATEIAQEMRDRYGARLGRKIDVRAVAAKLRRMAQFRLIHQLREGRAFHEALYSLTPGGG